MMQNDQPNNIDPTSNLGGDASESFLAKTPKLGSESLLTNITFPLARRGVEFYVANPGGLKESIFGELESTADKVDTAFQSIVSRMGDGAGLGASIRKNFTEAVGQVQLIGLDFKDVQTAAESTLEVFKTNVTLSEDQYTNLLSTQQVTGVAAKDLLTGFRDAGMAVKDITKEMYNVTQIATSIGVNARIVSAAVVGNLDKLNRYGFQNGIEGLAKMAAKASALRIDLSETLSIADDLMDPEGAIELASTLQRLGTTSAALTDPLRLMDMAQNDVGALQEELANMFSTYAEFNEENQRFEILPSARRELKQLEKELGLPLGTIEKMAIGTKELDKKLSEISFSGFDVPRETQELIANMSMMNEEGEYTIKYVDEEGKAREETTAKFLDDFGGDVKKMQEALGRQKEEEGKSIEDKMFERAGAQLSSLQQIEAYNRAGASALGLATGGGEYGKQILLANEQIAKDLNTGLSQNLGPNSKIATSMNGLADTQKELIKVLQSDTATKEDKKAAAAKMAEGYGTVGKDILTQAGTAVGAIATNVGETFGIEMPSVTNFMTTLGITDEHLSKFNTTVSNATGGLINFDSIVSKITSGGAPQTTVTPPTTTTTTGPTSVVIPTQEVNTPTPLQQVNEITSLPIQNTAENLLAPEIQQATKEGMSQALDEELSYYSASPSLAVTIKKDETEGKRIQVPKKPEEIPTETNLVQQTNENVTEINQTETQQTTNLGNETNFNVLNEVFNTTNEELKDISVTNSTLLKTSTEAFDKSQSLITNTNTLLSQIQQSSTLVKSNNTVASTTTTTTISPTPAAVATTPEATVTKPETPKAEETKETKIEVKRASKEEVGLFGQSPSTTVPLKIKEEEIEERTNFVTKLTDAEIKYYEDKKKEQVTFTDFLNKENVVKRESTKISVDEQKIKSDSKNKQIVDEKSVNSLVSQRQDLVTKLTDAEIKYYEDKKKEQVTFTGFLNEENDVKRENTKISVNEQTINSDSKKQQIVDERSVNRLVSERQNFVTSLSEQEIKNIEEQKKQQLSFFKFSDEEIKKQKENQKNTINQSNFVSDIQSTQLQVANELNENYKQRTDFVTQLSQEEISTLDQQNERQRSFDELLSQETTSRQEYVTALKDIEKDKSVTSVINAEDTKKINESEVSKKDESISKTKISKTVSELHKKMATLYDGVIDENEKSVVTAINDAEVLKTQTPEDTTRKIDNKNLFGTEPSALGKYVATGKAAEPVTPTVSKPFIPEFNKTDVDRSVTNFVNQVLPKSTGVNLFDTKPSALSRYVPTGKAAEPVTPTVFKPDIPKPTTGERTVVTETDFGFGQEIPTSVAEFKGAEDVISQFFTPEAIAAAPVPITQPDVEKVQELQKSTTSTQNINDNRTLDVTIKTPDIKDPAVAENYRKDVINILKGELPNMIERDKGLMDKMRANMTPNFGLTSSETPGFG